MHAARLAVLSATVAALTGCAASIRDAFPIEERYDRLPTAKLTVTQAYASCLVETNTPTGEQRMIFCMLDKGWDHRGNKLWRQSS